jgi:hypothetical protein
MTDFHTWFTLAGREKLLRGDSIPYMETPVFDSCCTELQVFLSYPETFVEGSIQYEDDLDLT